MASVIKRPNGTREVRFSGGSGPPRTLRLGKVSQKIADQVAVRIENLVAARLNGSLPDPVTLEWLSKLDDARHQKLAGWGLIDARLKSEQVTLGAWIDRYLAGRRSVKASTKQTFSKIRCNLIDYFGADRPLSKITPFDAAAWRDWLATEGNRRDTGQANLEKPARTDLASNTVRRRTGMAKQVFSAAVDAGLIVRNPFVKLPSTTYGNAKRQFFVPAEWIEKCIEVAPCTDWKTILALCRFGGLRCPSEVLQLTWDDVDLSAGRMTIHAQKTEHHVSGGVRQCPIFPELRPYLQAAKDAADPEGSPFVVNRYRDASQNLRSQFQKIIERAGLPPWPKLFQNLRATRETELLAVYPAKDVATWLGNSVPVAMKHYAMPREEIFEKAAREGASDSGRPKAHQNAHHSLPGGADQESAATLPDEWGEQQNVNDLPSDNDLCPVGPIDGESGRWAMLDSNQ